MVRTPAGRSRWILTTRPCVIASLRAMFYDAEPMPGTRSQDCYLCQPITRACGVLDAFQRSGDEPGKLDALWRRSR
jgi:hypothetical protein